MSLALVLLSLALLIVGLGIIALGSSALSSLALSSLALGILLVILASGRGLTGSGSSLVGLALSGLLLAGGRISSIVSGTRSGTSKQAREGGEQVPFLHGVRVGVWKDVADGVLATADVDGAIVGRDGRAHDES